jgi:iron(III) transport system permease protein
MRSSASRHRKRAFEFVPMLNFAVPGAVVGVAYLLALNAPPIESALTGLILAACRVFQA